MARARPILAGVLAALVLAPFLSAQESRPESAPAKLFAEQARWIWDGADARPVDAYRLFRKTFTAPARRKGVVRITADSEYRLFMNGVKVGRGPAPSPAGRATVDELAVEIREGTNTIAVIVNHAGVPTFARTLGRAGLIAELQAAGVPVVATDASWRWSDAWWVPTGERLTPMREFAEHLDGRMQAAGWNQPDFDDAGWKAAVEIGVEGVAPSTVLEMRDIPMPAVATARPASVLFVRRCSDEVLSLRESAKLLASMPPDPKSAQDAVSIISRPWLRGGGVDLYFRMPATAVALDFGEEVSGFPTIVAEADEDGVVVDLGYGEALEDGRVSVFRQDMPDCDRMTLRKGRQELTVFHHRAFRYAILAVRGGTARIDFRVEQSGFPIGTMGGPGGGTFSCSDPRLDRIWTIGQRTVQLCMDQAYMDCPWRERGQYVGDTLVEARVARTMGDTSLARRFLSLAAFCQPKDGLLDPAYPCDWEGWHGARAPNRIPGYGALWVVLLEEHYRATGDLELVRGLSDVIDRELAWFEPHRDPNGLITSVPEWNFIDWAPLSATSALVCLNLQYLMAVQAAARLDEALGRASRRKQEAARIAAAFQALCWDEARGLYHDAKGVYTAHTNALALLAVVDDPKIAGRILDQIRDQDVLQPATPYFEAFILRALAKHGRHSQALQSIRARWGAMVDAGATTFWEAFDARWSLCHGWSAEPVAFLADEIAGVTYDAPRKVLRLAPHLVDLKEIQFGTIFAQRKASASLWVSGDLLRAEVGAEGGVEIDVPAPDRAELQVNGHAVAARPEGGRIRTSLPGGSYRLEVVKP